MDPWTFSLGSKTQWIGNLFIISGCTLLALHIEASARAFPILLVGSCIWMVWAVCKRDGALAIQQGFLTVINLIGIWRWLT